MIKLQGHSLTPEGRFTPETFAMNLMERQSTASITGIVGGQENAPDLKVNDWLLDDEEPGAGIVWRIKTDDSVFNSRTSTYTLEHVINTLRDISIFGEVKPGDIAGDSGARTCTAKQAAQYVLGRQSIWTLGDFEYTDSAPYSFNGDDLFSAMEKITSTLDDPCWEYDLSSLPFKLHIRHISTADACEMRMGRNIATMRRTIDRTNMYTRIYPIGKKNLHIAGDYLSQNEGVWGRKDKVETDQSQETEAMLRLWALDRLKRHCEPIVTITIGGLDLSRETGEDLDRLTIGRGCRVPLPDFGITITERITKLAWKNKRKEPENVTVTLCNTRQDIASIISQQAAGGGGGARAAAKEAEEDHAWFVDTTSHVAMVAEAIIGRDGETVDWSRVAEIIVDGSGIHQQVVAAHGSIVTAFGRMDMTEESMATVFQKTGVNSLGQNETLYGKVTETAESLTAEYNRATEAEGSLSGRITATAESLQAEYTRATEAEGSLSGRITATAESLQAEYTRATEAEGSLSTRITANAEGLTSKVSAGEIASTLNQTPQSMLIQARTINLDGYVTVSQLNAVDAKIGNLTTGLTTASLLKATTLQATNFSFNGDYARWGTLSLGSIKSMTVMTHSIENKDFDHYHGITLTESNGVVTATIGAAQASEGTANFNIAATQYYIDGVAAAETTGWNAARAMVEPPAQGDGTSFTVKVPSATQNQQQTYTFTMQKGATPGSTGYASVALAGILVGRIEIGSWYDAGAASVTIPAANVTEYQNAVYNSTTHNTTIYIQAEASNGATRQKTFHVSGADAYAAGITAGEGHFSQATVTLQGASVSVTPIKSTSAIRIDETAVTLYNAGTVTKNDRGDSVTARPVVSSGGTVYYTAGTAVTKYKGNGGEFTVQGSAGPKLVFYGTQVTLYKKNSDGTYTSAGMHNWYYTDSSNGTQYYKAGTVTKYARGDSESITPISSTSVRLGASGTYYKGNGGEFTVQGSAQDAYKKLTSGGKIYYQANSQATYYQAGTQDSSTYYTRND